MCRLLGFVSDSKSNFTELLGNDFQEFVELSKVHSDGWGISNIGVYTPLSNAAINAFLKSEKCVHLHFHFEIIF